jgi:hypothetical protein
MIGPKIVAGDHRAFDGVAETDLRLIGVRTWDGSSQATRSGSSTAGRARSMLGRRRAATTGTPSLTTLPQGTWAPWMATIGTTATPRVGQDLGGLVGFEVRRP